MHFKILFNHQKSKSMKKKQFLITFLTAMILNPFLIKAQPVIKKGEKITTKADSVFYDLKNNKITANGNVLTESGGKKIKGDFVAIDRKNSTLRINGNGFLETEDGNLRGDEIFLDYKTEKGLIKNGKVFIDEVHFYISGEKINKISNKTYIAEKAALTSCDNPKKDWEIKANKIKATIDGYGYTLNTTLNAKKFPVLYMPWMFFPLKTQRESGFLPPKIKFSSDKGFEYSQPFYLVLSDQADATFYYHFMEKESHRKGLEFRIRNSESSYTEIFYDEMKDTSYKYSGSNEKKRDRNRYWFKMKSDLELGAGFKANIDLDHASDPDYISEFDDNFLGYNHANSSFSKNFGRSLEEDDDTKRTNRIFISKNFKDSSFETELFWNDDLVVKETNEKDTTVQQLPRVSYYIPRKSFLNLPLEFSLDNEYNYFHRIYGEKGHRFNFTPKIYMPFQAFNSISIEPSLHLNETFWQTEEKDRKGSDDEFNFRQIYGFDLKSSTSFFRIFDINGKNIQKLKHVITPEINYYFVPDQDQDEFPDFDDFDRLERKKEVEFKLVQTLTSKEKLKNISPDMDDYLYREFMRFELSQKYDISENEIADESETNYKARPFEDLYTYIRIRPLKQFYMEFDSKWSHYESNFSTRNISLSFLTKNNSRFGFEHRLKDEDNENYKTIRFTGDYIYSPKIRLHGLYETTLNKKKSSSDVDEKEIGIEYKSQCWTTDLVYSEDDDEKKITLKLYLMGLGGIYQSVSDK